MVTGRLLTPAVILLCILNSVSVTWIAVAGEYERRARELVYTDRCSLAARSAYYAALAHYRRANMCVTGNESIVLPLSGDILTVTCSANAPELVIDLEWSGFRALMSVEMNERGGALRDFRDRKAHSGE